MYADEVTDSMKFAISETQRRREIQMAYNEEHGIDPQSIRKAVSDILIYGAGHRKSAPVPTKSKSRLKDIQGTPDELKRLMLQLQEEMHQAAKDLAFEYAARLRDEIAEIKRELKEVG